LVGIGRFQVGQVVAEAEQGLDRFVLTANQGQHTGQGKEECQIDERLIAIRGGAEFNNHAQ
jgi:hypothetical protein